ncbi:MAG: hypothetical protein JW839_02910 [Candidatus Lokiarchaeota archaeon]|nr:hypothetical protein [Candidatus Lokiarchaeota archaeon]
MEQEPLVVGCPSCKAKWQLSCAHCKGAIKAAAFVCPECAAIYCIRCAIMKSERKEPCYKCGEPIWPEGSEARIAGAKPPRFECPGCERTWELPCASCKEPVKATTYVCPGCATFYCIRCAITKSERGESCSECGKAMQFG